MNHKHSGNCHDSAWNNIWGTKQGNMYNEYTHNWTSHRLLAKLVKYNAYLLIVVNVTELTRRI